MLALFCLWLHSLAMIYFGCTPGKVYWRPSPLPVPSLTFRGDPWAELDERTLDVAEAALGTDAKAALDKVLKRGA